MAYPWVDLRQIGGKEDRHHHGRCGLLLGFAFGAASRSFFPLAVQGATAKEMAFSIRERNDFAKPPPPCSQDIIINIGVNGAF
jgi:hypothetical protein